MKKLKFFRCKHCGNVVVKLVDKSTNLFCCGEKMEELNANTIEASQEKHLPVIEKKGESALIKVGSVPHPMQEEHYINFIAVETTKNYNLVPLKPTDLPEAEVFVGKAKIKAVYEYCNLHGLWKTEVK